MDTNVSTQTMLQSSPEELRVRLQLAHESASLTRYALKGTMFAGFAGIFLILSLALFGVESPTLQINGWILATISIAYLTFISLYGAFIFNRSASIAAEWNGRVLRIETSDKSNADTILADISAKH